MSGSIDQAARLILSVQGKDAIGDLRASVERNKQAVQDLAAQYDRGEVSIDDFVAKSARLSSAMEKQEAILFAAAAAQKAHADEATRAAAATQAQADAGRRASQALADYAATTKPLPNAAKAQADAIKAATAALADYSGITRTAHAEATRASAVFASMSYTTSAAGASMSVLGRGGNAGRSILEFSRLIEDAQYGVAGVLNNIPTLVMSLGGGGGLAGVISLVAVGANLLYKHWGDVTSLWQEAHTETEAERMNRLENATKRTAAETKELNKHKKEQAEIEKLLATNSSEGKAATDTVSKAIAQVGGQSAANQLASSLDEFDKTNNAGLGPEWLEARKKENQEKARKMLAAAQSGDAQAARAVAEQMQSNRSGRNSSLGKALLLGTADERAAAMKKEDEEREQAKKKEADEMAGQLAGARGGARALAEDYDEGKVKQDLIASGLDEAWARQLAPMVYAKLAEKVREKLQAKAREMGGATPEDARAAILADHAEKQDAEDQKLTPEGKAKQKQDQEDEKTNRLIDDLDEHHDRLAEKARKEELRNDEQAGKHVAGTAAGGYAQKQAELALAQNPGMPPEMAQALAQSAAYRGLSSHPDTKFLDPEQKEAAAKKIGGKAEESYSKRFTDVSKLNLDASTSNALIQGEIIQEMNNISSELRSLMNQQQRNARAMQGMRRANRNGGRPS